jgi:hypothetical protein
MNLNPVSCDSCSRPVAAIRPSWSRPIAWLFLLLAAAAVALAAEVASASGLDQAGVLATALDDPDPETRGLAAGLLGDAALPSSDVVAALAAVLDDESEAWRVRTAAARSLGTLGRRGAVAAEAALSLAARDTCRDWRVRAAAVDGLWAIEGGAGLWRAVALAGGSLVIATPRVDLHVVPRLAHGDGDLLDEMVVALADPDARVRALAALALGAATALPEPALSALRSATVDPDAGVRALASRALRCQDSPLEGLHADLGAWRTATGPCNPLTMGMVAE